MMTMTKMGSKTTLATSKTYLFVTFVHKQNGVSDFDRNSGLIPCEGPLRRNRYRTQIFSSVLPLRSIPREVNDRRVRVGEHYCWLVHDIHS